MARKAMNCPDLANATGLSINTINAYIAGKRNASTKSAGLISKALEVDITKLIEN